MPGTPKPALGPPGVPIVFNALGQKLAALGQQAQSTYATQNQGLVLDGYGNVMEIAGSNLQRVVTIGAAYQQPGVEVGTGLTGAGRAVFSGPAITTINLTAGSANATVGTVTGASLAAGQVIGAADVSDPSSGKATPAITPGTTILSVSGTAVVLSQPAAESGTGLYCAAGRYILLQDTGWVNLSLASGWSLTTGVYLPSVRLVNDTVWLSGAMLGNSSSPAQWTTIPATFRPAETISLTVATTAAGSTFGTISIAPNGAATQSISLGSLNSTVYLDGLNYRLT